MSLIASDGYEYEDLTQRILGNPLENTRNSNARYYAQHKGEAVRRRYLEGFDSICPDGDPGPSPEFALAHYAGLRAAGIISITTAVSDFGPGLSRRS